MECNIEVGDYVRHPDDSKLYLVEKVVKCEKSVVLDDGRYLGFDECTDILLESEGYDEFHRQER